MPAYGAAGRQDARAPRDGSLGGMVFACCPSILATPEKSESELSHSTAAAPPDAFTVVRAFV
jgi:hypothetical protein